MRDEQGYSSHVFYCELPNLRNYKPKLLTCGDRWCMKTDEEIVHHILHRNEEEPIKFLYQQCYPLFKSVYNLHNCNIYIDSNTSPAQKVQLLINHSFKEGYDKFVKRYESRINILKSDSSSLEVFDNIKSEMKSYLNF